MFCRLAWNLARSSSTTDISREKHFTIFQLKIHMVTMMLIKNQPCLLFLIYKCGSNLFFFFLSKLHLRKLVIFFLLTGKKKVVLIIIVTQYFALVRDLDSSRLLPIDSSINIAIQFLLETLTHPDCT